MRLQVTYHILDRRIVLSSLSLLVRTRKHTRIFATSDNCSTLGNDRHSKGSSTKSMVGYCEAWSKSALRRALVSIAGRGNRLVVERNTDLRDLSVYFSDAQSVLLMGLPLCKWHVSVRRSLIGSCRPTRKTALCSQRSSKVLQTL